MLVKNYALRRHLLVQNYSLRRHQLVQNYAWTRHLPRIPPLLVTGHGSRARPDGWPASDHTARLEGPESGKSGQICSQNERLIAGKICYTLDTREVLFA